MKLSKKTVILTFFCIELASLLVVSYFLVNNNNFSDTTEVNAQEGNLTVRVSRYQKYFKNDTFLTNGYLYWAELAGGELSLYGNTSDMFSYSFWDAIGNYTENENFYLESDRIVVHVRTTELYYQIRGNYYPDYFQDTNFVVIFDTFWAQFSYLSPEGESVYAPVTYDNKQILPEGAGIVSYAPTEGATIVNEGNAFGIVWEYVERAMDPFHKPLTYEITYNFDPIYLQFTEQMYQNQQQQQEIEQNNSLLNLLQTYFRIIAFFSIALSIIAALLGYLRAKRKFKSQLNKAKNMPKRMLKDIEGEIEPGKRISTLFNAFILILIISTVIPQTNNSSTPGIDLSYNEQSVELMGCSLIEETSRNINYHTIIDLGKDGIAYETVIMSMPYSVMNYSIWVDTTNVISFKAYNSLGAPVSFQEFSDRYLINNVQGYIEYEIIKPYVYYNNSDILVYLDYFWLYFVDTDLDPVQNSDNYSNADITFTVIIPEGAILYSASPENYLTLSVTPEGRKKVTFTHNNREIDPYHDPFSTQVTFSFFNVIEAIENQSARFEHWRVETDLTQQQVSSLTRNLFFISLLGIIAPILAFLLTYFIMRTRMLKKIQEEEQKYELLISVEESQLIALIKAQEIDLTKEPWKAMLGGYWELLSYLSRFTPINLLAANEDLHEKTIRKYIPSFLINETLEYLSVGQGISNSWLKGEQVIYNRQQSRDYLETVNKLIEKLEKWRKEST